MIEEQYNRSIHTKELQLTFAEKIAHFFIVWVWIGIASIFPLIHLQKYFSDNATPFMSGEVIVIIVSFIVGLIFYKLQKDRLKFEVVKTDLKRDELEKLIEEVGKELAWIPVQLTYNSFSAITRPGFFSSSWGEQITILFTANSIFINSICDIDQRPVVLSFGRNRKNVQHLVEAIKKAEAT